MMMKRNNGYKWLDQLFAVSIFIVAITLGLYRLSIMGFDNYGDSYHHWLISYLTAKNHYVYTDFKPNTMNIVWLPLFHYFAAFTMNITGVFNIMVLRITNVIIGGLTCFMVYRIVSLKGVKWIALASGLSLAVQPWFIKVNTLVLTETLCCFLIVAALYYYHLNMFYTTLFVGLAMLTRYEGWLFAILIFIVSITHKKLNKKSLFTYLFSCLGIILLWVGWSYLQTGNPFTWYIYQRQFLQWDFNFFHNQLSFNFDRLATYPRFIIGSTSKLFLLALASAIIFFRKNRIVQVFTISMLAYLLFLSFQHASGYVLYDVRHTIYLFPTTSVLLFMAFTNFKLNKFKRMLPFLSIILLLIIVASIPLFFQLNVLNQRMELNGEAKAGILIKNYYTGGHIICDSPIVIYYSKVEPEKFLSSLTLRWYMSDWNKSALKTWFKDNDVKYIVWENTSYTEMGYLFPELSTGKEITFNGITFKPLLKTYCNQNMVIVYKIEL